MRLVVLGLCVMALGGCATSPHNYARTGVSTEQLTADSSACAKAVAQTPSIYGMAGNPQTYDPTYPPFTSSAQAAADLGRTERLAQTQANLHHLCMTGKGYPRRTA